MVGATVLAENMLRSIQEETPLGREKVVPAGKVPAAGAVSQTGGITQSMLGLVENLAKTQRPLPGMQTVPSPPNHQQLQSR